MSNTSSFLETFLTTHRFQKIGSYYLSSSGTVERESLVTIRRRLPLVYAIFAGETCRYIGRTVQGYTRPLNYHRNDVMTDVRDGILHELKEGNEVSVYARTEDLVVIHEGLELNITDGFEQALIQRYVPSWNNFVHSAA